MIIKDKVLEAMKITDKPVKAGEVAGTLGIEKTEVSKAIKKLKDQGKVHSPKVCFYAPVK